MRTYTEKRLAQNEAAAPVRRALKQRASRCEYCLQPANPDDLTLHEVARGNGLRLKCLDKPFALLCAHWLSRQFGKLVPCHSLLALESQPRQLARIMLLRPEDFELAAFNELVNARAPQRIEMREVLAEVECLKAQYGKSRLRPVTQSEIDIELHDLLQGRTT